MLTKLEPADQKKVLHIVNCRGNDLFEAVSVCFAVRLELLTYLLTFVERSFGLNINCIIIQTLRFSRLFTVMNRYNDCIFLYSVSMQR